MFRQDPTLEATMPFIRVTLSSARAADAAPAIASGVTRLMAEVLGKKAELTSVLVETPSVAAWTVGGEPRPAAAHLEASVTAGTNTEEEKARFIAEAMNLLKSHIPGLHEATYVVVREMPATDWGYDGRTQAARRVMTA